MLGSARRRPRHPLAMNAVDAGKAEENSAVAVAQSMPAGNRLDALPIRICDPRLRQWLRTRQIFLGLKGDDHDAPHPTNCHDPSGGGCRRRRLRREPARPAKRLVHPSPGRHRATGSVHTADNPTPGHLGRSDKERYSEWVFVDPELFQRDHRPDHPWEPGQRPTIPHPQYLPLLEQRDGPLHRRANAGMSAVVCLLQLAQLPTRGFAHRRRHPTPHKAKIGQHGPAGSSAASPVANERASCIDPGVGSLTSSSRPQRSPIT